MANDPARAFRIPPELWERMSAAAQATNQSVSQWALTAFRAQLEPQGPGEKRSVYEKPTARLAGKPAAPKQKVIGYDWGGRPIYR